MYRPMVYLASFCTMDVSFFARALSKKGVFFAFLAADVTTDIASEMVDSRRLACRLPIIHIDILVKVNLVNGFHGH